MSDPSIAARPRPTGGVHPHAEIGRPLEELVPRRAHMEAKTQVRTNAEGLLFVTDFFDRNGDGVPDATLEQLSDEKGRALDRLLDLEPLAAQKNRMKYLAGKQGRVDGVYEKTPDGRKVKASWDRNDDGIADAVQVGDAPIVRLGRRSGSNRT